ncbi:hypothetical protein ACP4OV_003044 [Aristida adscensionis]
MAMASSSSGGGADAGRPPLPVPAPALSSGKAMPRVGFGTATATLGQAESRAAVAEAVLRALDAGYRHFDTAAVYGTEAAVRDAAAEAVRAGAIASRDELFVTSKLWATDAHPGRVIPALHKTLQVEVHPYCRQKKVREFCRAKGIQLCGYSPLGGKGTAWGNDLVMDSPVLKQIAQDRGRTIAQVCIRWVYEQGDCVIVKSFNEKRMRENLDIFDWELTDDDRRKIDELPESRGNYDMFVHESGPYKTADELWDGEIATGKSKESALISSE